MHYLLPLQLPPVAEIGSWDKLVYGAAGAVVSAILYYLLTRKKVTSETDKTYQTMALEISTSLAEWIRKFESGQKEMIAVVAQVSDLQDKLNDCMGECEDCHELLGQASTLLNGFESALKDMVEHAPLIEDLLTLKRRVARLTTKQENSIPPNGTIGD